MYYFAIFAIINEKLITKNRRIRTFALAFGDRPVGHVLIRQSFIINFLLTIAETVRTSIVIRELPDELQNLLYIII